MSATLFANNFTPVRNPRSAFRLVGTSKAWSDVIDRAMRVAATDVTTCLQGESGTGTEVILSLDPPTVSRSGGSTDLNNVERSTIECVIRDMDGNISKAARTLGISRTQLCARLRKHRSSHPAI